ncbi:hypothetical protein [Natronorubrum sp. DTA28]|uniref:hypothetical protein n=1 Tax=Natronorubrum sp. DTA28 TaxID=3447019 RepID=UPI003F8441A7
MSGIPRRRLLGATGVGLAGAIAGCSSSTDDENGDDDSTEAEETPEEEETDSSTGSSGSVSGAIIVDNLSDTDQQIDLLVQLDDGIAVWETETIEAGRTASIERDWAADAGQFRVTARLNEGDPVDITPSNWNAADCLSIFVRITGDDSMTYSSNATDGNCGGAADREDDGDNAEDVDT